MRILAIDPGTKCGLAWTDDDTVRPEHSECIDLARLHENKGDRGLDICKILNKIKPDFVCYEYVRRHMGVLAAHAYAGYEMAILMWCADKHVEYGTVAVGTVKKVATGSGRAAKDEMIYAAQRKLGYMGNNDNVADALWILKTALLIQSKELDYEFDFRKRKKRKRKTPAKRNKSPRLFQ